MHETSCENQTCRVMSDRVELNIKVRNQQQGKCSEELQENITHKYN